MKTPSSKLPYIFIFATILIFSGAESFSASSTEFLEECSESSHNLVQELPRRIETMNGVLSLEKGHFIAFHSDHERHEAPVSQPDYGQVTELRVTQNGEIYAIGDQRSYSIVIPSKAKNIDLQSNMLPVLYRKPCKLFGKLLGICQEQKAIFSAAVSAVFLSGYDTNGSLRSYVYGLNDEILDLSSSSSPHYQSDCGRDFVVLVGKTGTLIMDKSGTLHP